MLWSYKNTFCVQKTKTTTSFNNFFPSVSVFDECSQQYHDKQGTSSHVYIMVLHVEDWQRKEEIVEWSQNYYKIIFVFFAHKKYILVAS